jgi:membrane protein implicated in regulation of membrane protease activity
MSWSDFYLLCFLIGFSLSVLSFLAGAVHLHLPFKMHLPLHGSHHATSSGHAGGHISWLNASTVLAFLAWFGGTGYILSKHSHLVGLASLGIAIASGFLAGTLVFRFMSRLLGDKDMQMNDWDYRQEGAIGTVSIAIRPPRTGEVIFEQHGVRRSAGARVEGDAPIEKGTEVVISKYEKGIAYVRRWDEFTSERKS